LDSLPPPPPLALSRSLALLHSLLPARHPATPPDDREPPDLNPKPSALTSFTDDSEAAEGNENPLVDGFFQALHRRQGLSRLFRCRF
jgi:hypothetical protein